MGEEKENRHAGPISPRRVLAADGLPFGYFRSLVGPRKFNFDDILEAALGVGEVDSREAINDVYEEREDMKEALLGNRV